MVVMHGHGGNHNTNLTLTRSTVAPHEEFEEVLMNLLLQNLMINNGRTGGISLTVNNTNGTAFIESLSLQDTQPIGLTDDAFNNLRRFTVDENTKLDDIGDCGITLDPFDIGDDVVSLPCGHCYKAEAVKGWLQNHITCPLCREKVHRSSTW